MPSIWRRVLTEPPVQICGTITGSMHIQYLPQRIYIINQYKFFGGLVKVIHHTQWRKHLQTPSLQ